MVVNVFGIDLVGKSDEEIVMEGVKVFCIFWNDLGVLNSLCDYDIDDCEFDVIVEKIFVKLGVGIYKEFDYVSVWDILERFK